MIHNIEIEHNTTVEVTFPLVHVLTFDLIAQYP